MSRRREEGRYDRDRPRVPVWERDKGSRPAVWDNEPVKRSPTGGRYSDWDGNKGGRSDWDRNKGGRSSTYDSDNRRSPNVRGSPDSRYRERYDRDRHDRDRRDRNEHRSRDRERYERRDRERRRSRSRSPYNYEDQSDMPSAPSPPTISEEKTERSRTKSKSRDRDDKHKHESDRYNSKKHEDSKNNEKYDTESNDYNSEQNDANSWNTGNDWCCKYCHTYNFKRREHCFKRNCPGVRDEKSEVSAGITKKLLLRRLDALTTEERILEELKERCSKKLIDSIVDITVGREVLTGASKCIAYINFDSIADSTAAYTELHELKPPLTIDSREVIISYYVKQSWQAKPDYSNYYSQQPNYSTIMSETDRVNAAAAVAQSAITAAAARQMNWVPIAAPTFVNSASVVIPTNIPTGDGQTMYAAPDVRTFMYDETSGYYYDPATGLYYDGKTQYFYNNQTGKYMYWDAASSTYIGATEAQQNTDQPKLPNPPTASTENTIPEEKQKKEDKVKVAKKIAKDMERWAKTLNQKKENAKSNIVMEQVFDTSTPKGSADIGFSVLGAGPSLGQRHIREISPPINTDDFLIKNVPEPECHETDEGIIDWGKLTCLICKRKFPSPDVLIKHKTMSDLHKQNLVEHRSKMELLPHTNGYRDRAAERRMKFGEDDTPIIKKRYEPPPAAVPTFMPPPSVVDTIGGKMLQKMGWSEGRGLGKTEQGRIAPIEAEQRPTLAGLGQKKGIYTPTPGETYRDTVKKLMIARYKEVVGQED